MSYTNSWVCGKKYENNCAHYLTNWMIKKGVLSCNPKGAYYCESGRPIRAKEMRNVFINNLNLSRSFNPPKNGNDCFIYCEDNKAHQGHIYFGKKSSCSAGTGSADDFGMEYVEYYF